MPDEIKACPFCGTSVVSYEDLTGDEGLEEGRVACGNSECGAMMLGHYRTEAVDRWNTRQTHAPVEGWRDISPETMPPDKEYILMADTTKPYKSGIFLGQYVHNEGAWDCTKAKFVDAHVWQPILPPPPKGAEK
jgi:hypothetical protein